MTLNAFWFQFGGQGGVPCLKEGLTARVDSEKWCWGETGERAHGQDEAGAVGKHVWQDGLRDAQGGEAIDLDDVFQFAKRALANARNMLHPGLEWTGQPAVSERAPLQ